MTSFIVILLVFYQCMSIVCGQAQRRKTQTRGIETNNIQGFERRLHSTIQVT